MLNSLQQYTAMRIGRQSVAHRLHAVSKTRVAPKAGFKFAFETFLFIGIICCVNQPIRLAAQTDSKPGKTTTGVSADFSHQNLGPKNLRPFPYGNVSTPVLKASVLVNETGVKDSPPNSTLTEKLWSNEGWPFLERFCLDCHNEDLNEGELNLTPFKTIAGLREASISLQRVRELVEFGAMPPEDSEQPEVTHRKAFSALADRVLYSVTCDLRPRPGKVTARRLNRAEYNYSIRDLFGLDIEPAGEFPSDEVGAGFDNNGDILTLSTLLMEKYLDASQEVAAKVIVDPNDLPVLNRQYPSDGLLVSGATQVGRFNGRFFRNDGVVWIDGDTPYEGTYRFTFYGGSSIKSGKSYLRVIDNSGKLVAKGSMNYFGGSGNSDRFRFDLTMPKGAFRLFFVATSVNEEGDVEKNPDLERVPQRLTQRVIAEAKAAIEEPLVPNKSIDQEQFPHMVRKIVVEGPATLPRDAYPASHHRIVRKVARQSNGKWEQVEESAAECLEPLMRKAFRREIRQEEVARYTSLVSRCTDRGMSYFEGLQTAISAILVSPHFLFRVETPPPNHGTPSGEPIALTSTQLITRLSYFLWSSLPDEKLLTLAARGQFTDDQLRTQVERMISDARSWAMSEQFAEQWFGLRNLESHDVDSDLFPNYNSNLRQSMAEETRRLFMNVLIENRPIGELLSADYSFVNADLASHYGIPGVRGKKFERVSLEGTGRRGLLTHSSVLTLTSYPTRTSPVQRGKWILENILGTPPPEPPAGVPTLEDAANATASLSLREQMETHRRDPACASCHRVMDQLGFGLEEFDAVGKFRKQEGLDGKPDDTLGELPGGRTFNGATELTQILSETEKIAFARTATERLLTFGLGRELRPQDRCVIDDIIKNTEHNGFRLRDLIVEVVLSPPFRFYDWDRDSSKTEISIR